MPLPFSSTVHLEDLKLARRLARGDEKAFVVFFEQNYDRLYRFAMSRLPNDSATAEDMVQQSFTKALDRMSGFRGEAQLFTWLCTICRNQITDWQRAKGRQEERIVLVEDFPELQAVVDSFQAPSLENPQDRAQREELVRLIQVVLDRIPVTYGNVLEWRYIEGYSAKEVSQRMGIGLEAVNSLTARAKRAFADLYTPLAQAASTPIPGDLA